MTTRAPSLATRVSSSGVPCPAVQTRNPRRGNDPTQRNPQRSRRPSFRLLPFLPPRFPLPITSTRTPSKFASEIKPSAFKRAPAARVLTFKFSATVPAVPERSSTTSDGSSVIPFLEHPRDVPVGSSFSAAFQCSSARHTSHANRWNRVPTVAAKIDDAGRAGLRERRREEESESSIEFFL